MSGSDRSHGTKRMPRSNRTAGSSGITGSLGTNGCSWADRSNWSHRIAGTTGNSGSGRSPGSNRAAGNPGTNWCDGSNRPSRATGESRCNRSGWCRWTSRYCIVSKNDSFVQFCFSLAPIGARSGLCKRQIAQKKRTEQGTAPCSVLFYFLILFLQITL